MLRKKRAVNEEGVSYDARGSEELMWMSALAADSVESDAAGGSVDPRLLDDLQDFLPLLESFLDQDRKASSCFTRKAKIVYTKAPTKEYMLKKGNDQKGRRTSQPIPTRKCSIIGEDDKNENGVVVSSSVLSQTAIDEEKEKEEINALKNQLEELRQKLMEKDELVSSAEISKNQLTSAQEELKAMQYHVRDKDSMLKGFEKQLADAKIKLVERQAALEKIQWEATTSNNQVEKLQKDLKTAELGMSAFTILINGLTDDTAAYPENDDLILHQLINTAVIDDDIDKLDLQKMEEARKVYVAAVLAVKEYQNEDSLAAAASARFYLQSFVLSA